MRVCVCARACISLSLPLPLSLSLQYFLQAQFFNWPCTFLTSPISISLCLPSFLIISSSAVNSKSLFHVGVFLTFQTQKEKLRITRLPIMNRTLPSDLCFVVIQTRDQIRHNCLNGCCKPGSTFSIEDITGYGLVISGRGFYSLLSPPVRKYWRTQVVSHAPCESEIAMSFEQVRGRNIWSNFTPPNQCIFIFIIIFIECIIAM